MSSTKPTISSNAFIPPAPGPPPRKRLATEILLLILLGLTAFFAWQSMFEAVLVSGGSVFWLPLLWFSLTLVVFGILAILVRETGMRWFVVLTLFLPSFFFATELWHGLFVLVGLGTGFLAFRFIQGDLRERLHVSPHKSLAAGFPTIILGLCLTLSSQYFVHIQQLSWEELVPSFHLGDGQTRTVIRVLGKVYPPLGALQDDVVTVDAFLRKVRPQEEAASVENVVTEFKNILSSQGVTLGTLPLTETLDAAMLSKQRATLSRLAGREVSGNESMSDLISEVLRKKIVNALTGTSERARLPVPVLPMVLAALLFLTIYPVALLILPLWIGLSHGVLALLRRCHLVEYETIDAIQERIL